MLTKQHLHCFHIFFKRPGTQFYVNSFSYYATKCDIPNTHQLSFTFSRFCMRKPMALVKMKEIAYCWHDISQIALPYAMPWHRILHNMRADGANRQMRFVFPLPFVILIRWTKCIGRFCETRQWLSIIWIFL